MSAIHRRGRTRRGIMLVEILLALALSGLVAAGVASLLFAVAGGTTDRQELRRRNVRVEVLAARLDSAIRASCRVLGRDDRSLVLWVADSRGNGQPNLSELRRIEWDPTTRRMVCYEPPAALPEASDTAYDPATTDFVTTTAALRGTAVFEATLWANGVSAWSTRPSVVTASTRLVSYDVTIDLVNGETYTARGGSALRGTGGLGG